MTWAHLKSEGMQHQLPFIPVAEICELYIRKFIQATHLVELQQCTLMENFLSPASIHVRYLVCKIYTIKIGAYIVCESGISLYLIDSPNICEIK